MTIPGAIVRASPYGVPETIDQVQKLLLARGATIYARIDQQAELSSVNQSIAPLQFLLFGNPQTGGLLLAQNPAVALDLPLKIIAWEDVLHHVWVAYNEPTYLGQRYALPATATAPFELAGLLAQALD